MKHIVKEHDPVELVEFKVAENDEWTPEYEALPGDRKRAIHDTLLVEQGHICCYCNRRIRRDSSHIEHWHPQTLPPEQLALEYGNMLASCQRELDPGEPLRCGMKKGDWFDPPRMVSPLDCDCEARFRFTADGTIRPASDDDIAAGETILRLGLDLPNLNASRREAIGAILDDLDVLSTEELRTLAQRILVRDEYSLFSEYCIAVAQVLEGLIPTDD